MQKVATSHEDLIHDVQLDYYGKRMATCSSDRTVKIWDLNMKTCVAEMMGHQDQVWEVAYSPDGGELCSCADDGAVQVYSIAAAQAAAAEAEKKDAEEKEAAAAPA